MNENTQENKPQPDGSGPGFMVGLVLVVLLAILFFWYGFPRIRDNDANIDIRIPDNQVETR